MKVRSPLQDYLLYCGPAAWESCPTETPLPPSSCTALSALHSGPESPLLLQQHLLFLMLVLLLHVLRLLMVLHVLRLLLVLVLSAVVLLAVMILMMSVVVLLLSVCVLLLP